MNVSKSAAALRDVVAAGTEIDEVVLLAAGEIVRTPAALKHENSVKLGAAVESQGIAGTEVSGVDN